MGVIYFSVTGLDVQKVLQKFEKAAGRMTCFFSLKFLFDSPFTYVVISQLLRMR